MRWRVLFGVLAAAVTAAPVCAQEAALRDVEELARLGRTAEARTTLDAWWGSEAEEASRRELQRALWLRGTLALDPAMAERDFRRLVVEYPGGPFSDLAMMRLAQAAHASGDGEGARDLVDRLGREYPSSPVRRDAETWLEAAGDPPAPASVSFADVVPSEELPADTVMEPAEQGSYAVQLGAFSSVGRARDLAQRLDAAGFEARLVRVEGSDLVRVRVGRFDTRGPADDLLGQLRELGYTAALAQDADRERPVR